MRAHLMDVPRAAARSALPRARVAAFGAAVLWDERNGAKRREGVSVRADGVQDGVNVLDDAAE